MILIILLILFLGWLDFTLGRKSHHRNLRFYDFKKTKGDYNFYSNGSTLFDDMFEDIRCARESVEVLFFIVKTDDLSMHFLDLLQSKAKDGVEVKLVLDRFGSFRITPRKIREMREAGIQFAFCEKPSFPYFFYKMNRRNHRKITVVDNEIAYVGGYNVGKEYIGKDAIMGDWRDYHLRLKGEVVQELRHVFYDDWYLATGEEPPSSFPATSTAGQYEVEVCATDGGQLEDIFLSLIDQAEEELLIGTPYFIPSQRLFEGVLNAIQRGVDVKVILPLKADHAFVKEAGLPYLTRVVKEGGEVHFFDAGFYHAKVIMVDGRLCDIGTANFDRRSLFLNKEVNTLIYDEPFIRDLRETFLEDFESGRPLTEEWIRNRPFITKVNSGIGYLLRPFY
ncbi:cardiolipin synthetase [Pontibacillus halophilus JSM 076056 = DSM 19796]|uniref:Cardiolipin synthase n=1 Tax=Pontibacillus halophilus JSM 076056 = DSM 19796 TaxID=1385510 RepID=A0A0A5GPD8_9BACI|nr:cardiolipin synthetase [Pontibacillus halophilus JSM 076056 = DSM 19796]